MPDIPSVEGYVSVAAPSMNASVTVGGSIGAPVGLSDDKPDAEVRGRLSLVAY